MKNRVLFILLIISFLVMAISPLQIIFLILFGWLILLLNRKLVRLDSRAIFYIGLILLSGIQLLFFFRDDYNIAYLINSFLATLLWSISFLCYLIIKSTVQNQSISFVNRLVDILFKLNIGLIIFQYIIACIVTRTLFPFYSSVQYYGMSTGDHLKGFFPNSSVTMIIMAFYLIYFAYKKDKKVILAAIALVATTYMSGILFFSVVVAVYVFFALNLRVKVVTLISMLFLFILTSQITPENIDYVEHVLTKKIKDKEDPIRKLVSFEDTAKNWVSSPSSFLFGEGSGKFSSRTSFVTGGQYVSWYPKNLEYRSEKFEENHFRLWNRKALYIAFRDGTQNQPFSVYNQIVGEFGLIGVALLFIYLFYGVYRWRYLSYGKIIVLSLPAFFLLDYWFDYFTVIVFFELFLNLNIKEKQNAEKQLR